jgi:hypothetical protein
MDTRLSDMILERMVHEYGAARVIGSIYRWAIQTDNPDLPVLLALDRCTEAYVTAWVFDARQPTDGRITHFTVRNQAEIEPTINEICRTITRLVNGQADGGK